MTVTGRFRVGPARAHGTNYRYTKGCRCDECRRANTEYDRDLRRRRKTGDVWDHTSFAPPQLLEDSTEPVFTAWTPPLGKRDLFFVLDMQRILAPDDTADLVEPRQLVYAHRVDREPHRPPFAEDLDELEKSMDLTRYSKTMRRRAAEWAERAGRGW